MGLLKLYVLGIAAALGAEHSLVLKDEARKRNVPLQVYCPETEGKAPVVIWSHGLGGSKDHYRYLGVHWAAHGFVGVFPTHFGSDSSLKKRGFSGLLAMKAAADDSLNWEKRAKDISFVLDSLGELEIDCEINSDRVAVGGHSFGSQTTLAIAGAKLTFDEGPRSFTDDRVKAFIAVSPQGTGQLGFVEGSWREIKRPVLVLRGTADKGITGETAEWRAEAFAGLAPGEKFEALISGATHTAFIGHELSETTRITEALSLRFLERTLKGSERPLLEALPNGLQEKVKLIFK